MKILLLTRQLDDDLSLLAQNHALALSQAGHEVQLVHSEDWMPKETGKKIDKPISKKIQQLSRNVDIIHAFGYRSAWACAEAFASKRNWYYSALEPPKTSHAELLQRLQLARHGIASSRYTYGYLEDCQLQNTAWISPSNAATPKIATGNFISIIADSELGFSANDLINTLSRLWLRCPLENVHLKIPAHLEGSLLAQYPEWVDSGRVFFQKPEELPKLLILPEAFRGFRMGTLQALSAGVPLILHKSGGNLDLIDDHESGLFYESTDYLGDVISSTLQSSDQLEKISEKAKAKAHQYFSHDVYSHNILSIYTHGKSKAKSSGFAGLFSR